MNTAPRRSRSRALAAAALTVALTGLSVVAMPLAAHAATITVTTNADSGAGSLREALTTANSGDEIHFANTVTSIALATTIDFDRGVSIVGPGADLLTITRANTNNFNQLQFTPEFAGQSLSISGVTIEGVVGGTGIGVYAGYGDNNNQPNDVTFDGVVIRNEKSGAGGGAFYIYSGIGDILIQNSSFTGNGGTPGGPGALSIDSVAGDVDIYDSSFSGNTTDECGGAFDIENIGSHTLTINSTDFIENVGGAGGAFCIDGAAEVVISDGSTFLDNSGMFDGGAAYMQEVGFVTVMESSFETNDSNGSGGALNLQDSVGGFDIRDSLFSQNEAGIIGGAVFAEGGGAASSISNTVFVGNIAEDAGGAVAVGELSAALAINVVSMLGNTAGSQGGGLAVGSVVSDGLVSIESSTFATNSAGEGLQGSSIWVDDIAGEFAMTQSTMDDADDAGLYAVAFGVVDNSDSGSIITILHSTIVGPGAFGIGDGVSGFVLVSHTILDSVSPELDGAYIDANGDGFAISLAYSLLSSSNFPGINNLGHNTFDVADMKLNELANNGGPTLTRLPKDASLAHNGGNPDIAAGDIDFDQRLNGFARVVQVIDIGAVEVQTITLAATGATVNPLLPIGGGVLVLLGLAAVLWRRRWGSVKA